MVRHRRVGCAMDMKDIGGSGRLAAAWVKKAHALVAGDAGNQGRVRASHSISHESPVRDADEVDPLWVDRELTRDRLDHSAEVSHIVFIRATGPRVRPTNPPLHSCSPVKSRPRIRASAG